MGYTVKKSSNNSHECFQCKNEFHAKHHGGAKQFCSYSCARYYTWANRERKPKKIILRRCVNCDKEYEKNPKFSLSQWSRNKFCSPKCAIENRRIKDGMTKGERYRRKKGHIKKGTPQWIELIRSTTREGMMKPDVREKLSKPRRPLSLESIQKRSLSLVGKMPKNLMSNGSYPNVQRGDYECSKGTMYFRSKWEANYALFLDFLVKNGDIKKWEYEVDVFVFEKIQFGTRSYRPDFKVINNDHSFEYHEVKGYMDSRSKTKLKRMQKYYPDIKLVLIDKPFYNDLHKKFKKILNFY
jgi:hypothetical protein